jgi:serine-type D-Ala-D-Ala carboxypeptidase (penicillin-binding protein 5/6)
MRRLVLATVVALGFAGQARAAVPQPNARAFYVMNAATGEVLASHNANEAVPIASITKLMTVIVALEHAKWNDVVHVREDAAAVGESTINLRAGERITVGDLVKGALIQSANDAADALADYVGKGNESAFIQLMNAKASELGLARTHFARPDGLDAHAHYSTALDVTRLAETAMRDPRIRAVVRERTASISGGRRLHTWNDLLGVFNGLYGVKTGHTSAAGWCEVAAVRRNGVTLYTTVLGSPTRSQRNADLASLLRWGISRYRQAWVVRPQRVYLRAAAGFGKGHVPLAAAGGAAAAVRVDKPLVERVVAPATVELPVKRGQRIGEVRVYSGKRLVARRALVAQRSVARPGFGGRVGFYASRTLHHIGGWF